MKKATKVLLIVSIALVFGGLAVFVGGMSILHWNLNELPHTTFETNTYDITESFENLSIDTNTDDISFVLSDDKSCKVICYERDEQKHTVEVKDKTLEISEEDTGEWYDHIGFFSFGSSKMTVYLPKERYDSLVITADTGDVDLPQAFTFASIDITSTTGDVDCSASSEGLTKIKLTTGDIKITDASSGAFDLSVTTGDIRMDTTSCEGDVTLGVTTGEVFASDITCKGLTSTGSTGAINLQNTVASKALSIERSTGDVRLDGCDADEIFIKTATGDVTGTLLSEKVFITDSSSGDVNVPKTATGGQCEITTSTGDIHIDILDKP